MGISKLVFLLGICWSKSSFFRDLAATPSDFLTLEEPLVSKVGTVEDAYHFGDFASFAYCPDGPLRSMTCKRCRAGMRLISIADDPFYGGRALVVRDDARKEVVLAFRGSANLQNWIQNIIYEYSKLSYVDGARVHGGFKDSSDALVRYYRRPLIDQLLRYPAYRFIITGHSLGGAIAILAAVDLNRRSQIPWRKMEVFTYGQPRTGNVEFARFVNSKPMHVTRVVNENDIVPQLIPEYANFVHHATEMYIANNRSIICSASSLEDPNCSKRNFPNLSVLRHGEAWDFKVGANTC